MREKQLRAFLKRHMVEILRICAEYALLSAKLSSVSLPLPQGGASSSSSSFSSSSSSSSVSKESPSPSVDPNEWLLEVLEKENSKREG